MPIYQADQLNLRSNDRGIKVQLPTRGDHAACSDSAWLRAPRAPQTPHERRRGESAASAFPSHDVDDVPEGRACGGGDTEHAPDAARHADHVLRLQRDRRAHWRRQSPGLRADDRSASLLLSHTPPDVITEEDAHAAYSQVVLKYFIAEGVASQHAVYVASADDDPAAITKV